MHNDADVEVIMIVIVPRRLCPQMMVGKYGARCGRILKSFAYLVIVSPVSYCLQEYSKEGIQFAKIETFCNTTPANTCILNMQPHMITDLHFSDKMKRKYVFFQKHGFSERDLKHVGSISPNSSYRNPFCQRPMNINP